NATSSPSDAAASRGHDRLIAMGVLERDPEATAATLTRWLRDVAGVGEPVAGNVSIPGATGWSNETILFDATWSEGDGDEGDAGRATHELVARIAPSGHQVFPDDTFRRQYDVMDALAPQTDVPMARVHWYEPD